jgi:hypothetical protein
MNPLRLPKKDMDGVGLNICAPHPHSYKEIQTPQWGGTRRWGLWEVVRS